MMCQYCGNTAPIPTDKISCCPEGPRHYDPYGLLLDQQLSKGPLTASDFQRDWWDRYIINRYIINRDNFRIGYDLTCWALPLRLSVGGSGAFIGFLCFDIDIYWGE